MRTRTILLLSLGGVLTASSASAAVNAASPGHPASLPGIVQPASTGSSSSVPTSVSVPGPVVTLPGESVVVGEPVPGAPTQQRYVIGEAATVIVDTANGRVEVVALAPHPGWAIMEFEQDDDGTFELRLESPTDRVRFDAAIVDGLPVATIRPDDDDPSATTPNGGSTVTTVDDHDDDHDDGDDGDDVDDHDDDDRTSTTVVTTPSSGSTATTVDDHDDDRGDDDRDDDSGDDDSGDDDSGDDDSDDDSGDDDSDDD